MRITTWISCAVALGTTWATSAGAGCNDDCATAYQAAMTACQEKYPDASDQDALNLCLDQAQSSYEACLNSCLSSSVGD
jgi:hypothetical protein